MAFFRSDYMLHIPRGERGQKQLKQVELNTFSVAGGVHSARISQMHEYARPSTHIPHLITDHAGISTR